MPECANCKRHVSTDYHRVFSVDGVLYSCLFCTARMLDRRPTNSEGDVL